MRSSVFRMEVKRPPYSVFTRSSAGPAAVAPVYADVAEPEIGLHRARRIDEQHAAAGDARRGLERAAARLRLRPAAERRGERLAASISDRDRRRTPAWRGPRRSSRRDNSTTSPCVIGGERAFAAALRPAVGMRAEQRGAPVDADDLRRIGILGRLDELDLAIAVAREFRRVETRTHERVAQQLDHAARDRAPGTGR